jgi:adenylate kinase family enzyme
VPRKVLVKGSSGAGKSTVGRRAAERLGVRYVELDALHHIGPNWTEATPEQLQASVRATLAGLDAWVVDGNYERKLADLVSAQADTIVWLDLPLHVKLRRLHRRTRERIRTKEVLWGGNVEGWRTAVVGRESLFVWAVRQHFAHRRRWPARYPRALRLRSQEEVERWLASLTAP